MLPDAVVLVSISQESTTRAKSSCFARNETKMLVLRTTTASGDHVLALRVDGFVQDKRILACATIRRKKMPEPRTLNASTCIMNEGLKVEVFAYKQLMFK